MGTVRRALVCLSLLLTLASAPVLAALGVLLGAAIADLAALSGLMRPSSLTTLLLGYVRARPLLAIALIAALQLGVVGVLGLGALGGSGQAGDERLKPPLRSGRAAEAATTKRTSG